MIKVLFVCHGSTAKNSCKARHIGIGQENIKIIISSPYTIYENVPNNV